MIICLGCYAIVDVINIFRNILKAIPVVCITMSSEHKEEQPQETDKTRERGLVKWFNNRAGYGFITVCDGSRKNDDIFVHHSALRTSNEQYKYLVQGEYVDFELVETTEESDHQWQAGNVSGVDNGSLMCETRNNSMQQQSSGSAHEKRIRGPSNKNRPRGGGRTFRDEDGVEWMLVKRNVE